MSRRWSKPQNLDDLVSVSWLAVHLLNQGGVKITASLARLAREALAGLSSYASVETLCREQEGDRGDVIRALLHPRCWIAGDLFQLSCTFSLQRREKQDYARRSPRMLDLVFQLQAEKERFQRPVLLRCVQTGGPRVDVLPKKDVVLVQSRDLYKFSVFERAFRSLEDEEDEELSLDLWPSWQSFLQHQRPWLPLLLGTTSSGAMQRLTRHTTFDRNLFFLIKEFL